MTKFEENYRKNANRFLVLILWAHLPLLTGFALWQGSSVGAAIVGSLLLSAIPSLLLAANPAGLAASISIACSTMGMSGLLIYLGNGKIEYHFHVFSFLAVLTAMCQPWAQLAAAGAIAAHHVIGWMLAPRALFNYEAAFSDVLVHAFFVVVETAICLRIVWQLDATVRARGILEEQVSQGTASVRSGTKEIEAFARTLADTASTQARMIEQVAEASQTLEVEWKQKEAVAVASRQNIESAVGTVENCRRDLEQINRDMGNLAEANRKVSGVMALVMDIARQTNILAVNASIEASRSGAAGAGFGIIADQVRDLARRTAEAARDIESVVTESISTVDRNAASLEELTASMRVVSSAAGQMSSLAGQLVELGQAQGEAMVKISGAMQKISAETQHLAAGAEESSSTTAELSLLAEDLNATLASLR